MEHITFFMNYLDSSQCVISWPWCSQSVLVASSAAGTLCTTTAVTDQIFIAGHGCLIYKTSWEMAAASENYDATAKVFWTSISETFSSNLILSSG